MQLTKLHVWNPETGSPLAAFLIINTGGRDVVISKVTVRGQSADFASGGSHPVFYGVTTNPVTADFNYTAAAAADAALVQIGDTGSDVAMHAATGDLTLTSGSSMVVFISNPDSITINDIGLTVGITVFTSQAMYYQEANVQAT